MELLCQVGLAGLTAGILTYCDLDTVFDAPPHTLRWPAWFRLLAWWWGFVLANVLLGSGLYYALRETYLKDLNPWLGAVVAGAGYTAFVRLKFTTVSFHGKDTPIGLETLYEGIKSLVHKRINRIIRLWRMEQCASLAVSNINDLRQRALLMVGSDALISEESRGVATNWIEQVANDESTPDEDRRRHLALFIITERRPSQP